VVPHLVEVADAISRDLAQVAAGRRAVDTRARDGFF
jgi:IclR family transcriptional regulator, pca regulon regulatory protein